MTRWKRDVKPKIKSKKFKTPKKFSKFTRKKKTKNGPKKRIKTKQSDPRIAGILDRRVPELFRVTPFVTISLTKFVILSTGSTPITAGRKLRVHFKKEKFKFLEVAFLCNKNSV